MLVQYGANQPYYDLVADKNEESLKRHLYISVKGSQDGGWMLAVRYVKPGVDYRAAIDKWLEEQLKHDDVVFLFVQFMNVALGEPPRVYIARPQEIALHMKTQCNDRGHGSLQEDYQRDHPGSKYSHKLPEIWRFSKERLDCL